MDIYGLDVVEVPTNMDMIRDDEDDEVYRTAQEKYRAIIALIKDAQKRGQPMLVGTASIEKSEILSELLKKDKVPHQVLNARYHEQEAHIIAQAGVPGAVTIATNMAGRGTDIQLGGNPDMLHRGLGRRTRRPRATSRRPSRSPPSARRSGPRSPRRRRRRSKPAVSTSSAPSAMRAGASTTSSAAAQAARATPAARASSCRSKTTSCASSARSAWTACSSALGLKEDEAIVHPWINKALEKAQAKVEARNFDIRKNLLKYDNVMNDQRKAIFEQRRELMSDADLGRDHRRHAPPGDRRSRRQARPGEVLSPSSGTSPALKEDDAGDLRPRSADRRLGQGGRHRRGRGARAPDPAPPTRRPPRRPPISDLRSCARSRRRCCCRRSIICGASISSRSSISARSSACAATASAIR